MTGSTHVSGDLTPLETPEVFNSALLGFPEEAGGGLSGGGGRSSRDSSASLGRDGPPRGPRPALGLGPFCGGSPGTWFIPGRSGRASGPRSGPPSILLGGPRRSPPRSRSRTRGLRSSQFRGLLASSLMMLRRSGGSLAAARRRPMRAASRRSWGKTRRAPSPRRRDRPAGRSTVRGTCRGPFKHVTSGAQEPEDVVAARGEPVGGNAAPGVIRL